MDFAELCAKIASGTFTQAEADLYNSHAQKPVTWEPAQVGLKPALTPTETSSITSALPSVPSLLQVKSTLDGVTALIGQLISGLDEYGKQVFTAEHDRLRAANMPDARAAAKLLAGRATDERRRETIAANESRVLDAIKRLEKYETDARKLADIFGCIDGPNAKSIASVFGLGSAERSRFAEQTRGMGAAELAVLGRIAIETKNRTMAAAVKLANDQLPRDSRLLSSSLLAEKVFGDEATAIYRAYTSTRSAVQSALSEWRQVQTGKADLLGSVRRGLEKHGDNRSPTGSTGNDLSGNDSPISKISRGLRQGAA